MDTIRVTIDCGGMAPPGNDDADTRRIAATVLGAFVDPDPGDVKVEVAYVNDQTTPADEIAAELIERRRAGGDCTEDESAWIKAYFDTHHPEGAGAPLAAVYTCEHSEWAEELARGDRRRTPESTLDGPWVTARVHDEGDHWTLDLVDANGNYSEFVWDHYIDADTPRGREDGRDGNFDTMQQALVRVPEFIAEHGAEETWNTVLIVGVLPEDIRIELTQAGGDYRVYAAPYLPSHYDGDNQSAVLAPFGEVFIPSLYKAIDFVARAFHAIECPNCGHDDELQVVEDRALYWTLAVEDRKLVNSTGFEVSDAGGNERMFCGSCDHTFAKPATWQIVYR